MMSLRPVAKASCDGLATLQLGALLLGLLGVLAGRHGRTMLAAPVRLAWMALAEPRWSDPAQVAETTIPDDLPGEIPELVGTAEIAREFLKVACCPVGHGLGFADQHPPNRQLEQLVAGHVQTDRCDGWVWGQISE
uniref:(northern house mosquito) hypothetical protein n=1 Tax=Culex pipiens TaxID=7175 RepID=A0A8D8B4U8_CULPI